MLNLPNPSTEVVQNSHTHWHLGGGWRWRQGLLQSYCDDGREQAKAGNKKLKCLWFIGFAVWKLPRCTIKGLDHDCQPNPLEQFLDSLRGLRAKIKTGSGEISAGKRVKKAWPIGQLGFQCVWMWNPSPVDRISYSTTVSGIVPFSSKSIHELLNRITWSPGHCGVVHLCSSINISVASPATKQLQQIKSRIQKLESTRAKSTKKKRACPFLTKKST